MEADELIRTLEDLGCRKFRRLGANISCTCPFPGGHKHGADENPSFSMRYGDPDDMAWNCKSCGLKGRTLRTFAFQVRTELGKDIAVPHSGPTEYQPKIQTERDWAPLQNKWYNLKKSLLLNIKDFEKHYGSPPQYALERGLSPAQIERWKIGFDSYYQRLFIPVFDVDQNMVGYSGRAVLPGQKPKYFHCPGFVKEHVLYGEHLWDPEIEVACLSEGFFDVWNMDQLGLPNPSAFFGMGVGEKQIYKILKRFKRVVVFPHNDPEAKDGTKPGEKMAREWAEALRKVGVECILAPVIRGRKDIGDWSPQEILYVWEQLEKLHHLGVRCRNVADSA